MKIFADRFEILNFRTIPVFEGRWRREGRGGRRNRFFGLFTRWNCQKNNDTLVTIFGVPSCCLGWKYPLPCIWGVIVSQSTDKVSTSASNNITLNNPTMMISRVCVIRSLSYSNNSTYMLHLNEFYWSAGPSGLPVVWDIEREWFKY